MTTRQRQHHEGDSARRRRTGTATLGLALLGLTLTACGPDPQGKFDEYVDEAEELAPKMDIPPPKMDIPPPDPGIDLSGTSLLAISTIVSEDLPLQFLSTVVQNVDGDGNITIDITLQPLSLDQGMVTVPREPVGPPLEFKAIPVVDGKYTVDAGETMVTGAANPITGSDITATLVLEATVVDADFICGTVSGMVTAPLMASIDGSTFASVRLDDPDVLPTDVTINCARDTRTDM
jgi:hypothetical protein